MKKRKITKALSLLLAVIMLLSITPFNGLGELLATKVSAAMQGDYTYEVVDSKVTILEFNTEVVGDVTIPDTLPLNGVDYPVVRIGKSAFAYCGFTSVTVPEGVTVIENSAFSNCDNVTTVTLHDGVTVIGDSAFYYCNVLTTVNIPDTVTKIGEGAFTFCKSLTSINIPASVTKIGDYAFSDCHALTEITVDGDNPNYMSEDGILYSKDKTRLIQYPVGKPDTSYTIQDGVTSVGVGSFAGSEFLTEIIVSDSVTEIDDLAFVECVKLKDLTIGEGVKSLGYGSFGVCVALTTLVIPDSVLVIDEWAFFFCTSLTDLTIGNGVKSVGELAFMQSALTSITLPKSVTELDKKALFGIETLTEIIVNEENSVFSSENGVLFNKDKTRLINYPFGKEGTNYEIPQSVTEIGDNSFYQNNKLTEINIPNSVTRIGEHAFYDSALKNIDLGTGVTIIDEGAFSDCDEITGITFPNSVRTIDSFAFSSCDLLADVDLGEGVTSIGSSAFVNCYEITSIDIPDSVTTVGDSAFYGCSGLKTVTLGSGVTCIYSNTFSYCVLLTDIEIPNGVTSIDYRAFEGCFSLTSIDIPDSVTTIDDGAFMGCISLEEIDIPQGVTYIGEEAFYECHNLTTINLPDSVDHIGESAFEQTAYYGTAGNWEIGVMYIGKYLIASDFGDMVSTAYAIKEGTITIADRALYNCHLTSLTIPGSVENIGYYAFAYNDIKAINFSDNLLTIGDGALAECELLETITVNENNPNYMSEEGILFDKNQTQLITFPAAHIRTNYVIPNTVKTIGYCAFGFCDTLTQITIPEGVEEIGEGAFQYCLNLSNLTLPSTLEEIGDSAFYDCTSFTSLIIPKGVIYIEWSTFAECTALQNIAIPNTVSSIGDSAFDNCISITDVYYEGTERNWDNVGVNNHNGLLNAHIHCGGVEAGFSFFDENGFGYSVDADGNATLIGFNFEIDGDVEIPAICTDGEEEYPVTGIGAGVFSGFDEIDSVTIPGSVTHIGEYAFDDCTPLSDVYFGGTEEQWNAIDIEEGNDNLMNATLHFAGNPDDPEDPGAEDYTNAKLPETTVQTAKYKNNVTVKITARGIPATGFLVVDGKKIAPDATGTATFEAQFQAKEGKSFKAHIEDKDGNVKVAEKEYKVNVDTGFFARLVAFFVDFIFNGFKWKKVNVEF